MHTEAWKFLKQIRQQERYDAPVLEVGSININGSARDLWGDLTPYVGVDIVAGKNVDYIIDIRDEQQKANLPIPKYRTILCTEVLEHCPPETLIPAFFTLMDDYCTVVITAAGRNRKVHSANGAPRLKKNEYYKNVERDVLHKYLLNASHGLQVRTCVVMENAAQTDIYAVATYSR